VIRASLKSEWEDCKEKNSQDDYSKACIDSAIEVMTALEDGEEVHKAHDKMYGHGLSGFMAGCVAQMVSRFSPRGEEFKDFWNKQFGVDEKADGVVNPAVLTIKEPSGPH